MLPIHLLFQRQLERQLPNMHGRHPAATTGPCTIFSNVVGMLLGNHACTGATPLPWPTEMAYAVAVGHQNDVAQAFIPEKMH